MSKIDQLKKILEIVNSDKASNREIAGVLASVISAIKNIKTSLESDMSIAKSAVSDMQSIIGSLRSDVFKSIDSAVKELNKKAFKELNTEVYKLEQLIKEVPQFDSKTLETKWSIVLDNLEEKVYSFKELLNTDVKDLNEKVNTVNERVDNAVKDLEVMGEKVKSIELRPTGRGTSVGIQLYVDGVRKGRVSTVNLVAGSGITLTHATSGQRNDITITAGGGALSEITISGTINDSNTAFTAPSEPTYLIINGAMYKKTGGAITWSYSAGNITLSSAVGQGGSIYGLA